MKFGKKTLAVLFSLLVALAVLLSACGGASSNGAQQNTNTESDAAQTSGSTAEAPPETPAITPEPGAEITHLTLNTEDDKYLDTIASDFGKANPNIKIKFVMVPWDEFDAKLQTMVAGGTTPDVTSHYAMQSFAGYQAKNMVYDMTPLIQADNFKPGEYGIDENLYNSFNVDGRQYAIPFRTYVSVLAYNKDLFDKAGIPYPTSDYEDKSWTWDKLIEDAKKLTKISSNPAESQYGLTLGWESPLEYLTLFGAKVYDDATWTNGGFPHECYFDSPEAMNAYQMLVDMVYKDKILIPPAASQSIAGSGDPFLSGKVGMVIEGAWGIGGVKDMPFKLGIAAIPWYHDVEGRSTNYTDPLWIMKDSKCPNASYLWIKYQLQKDVQEKVTELSGNCPINSTAMDKYFNYFPDIDAKDMEGIVKGGIKYGINSYGNVVVYSGQIDTVLRNEWNPVLNGKAQPKDVAPVIQQKVSALIQKLNTDNGK